MRGDPLYGPKLKIKWAHKHIGEVANAIAAFSQTKPCIFVKELDTQTNEEVTKARLTRRLPETVVIGTSYAIHDLRSALDQLVYALAVKNGATDAQLRNAYFPIAESPENFELPHNKRKIEMLSSDAIKFIGMYKPYKGGNDDLWALSWLDILDKHKVLIDVGMQGGITQFSESSVHPISIKLPLLRTLDEDIELWRHPAGTEQQPEAQFALLITLRDAFFVDKPEPVAMVLHRIAHTVEGIVAQAEDRFFGRRDLLG